MVWSNWTEYGHVGYVESVSGTIINVWDSTGPCINEEDPEYRSCIENGVSEETDKICRANAKKVACMYETAPSDYIIAGDIYLDNIPSTPVETPNNKPEEEN